MADAYLPRIERAMRQMQKPRFKVCDRASMALLAVVALSFVMFAAGSTVMSIPVMGFNASADVNKPSSPAPNGTRSHRRLLHRVKGVMRSNCLSKDDIVFGAQVLVNKKPYLHALVYVCNSSLMLDNPVIKEIGELQTQCADENNGVRKIKDRAYPVEIQTADAQLSYTDEHDACIIWTIMDMLKGVW